MLYKLGYILLDLNTIGWEYTQLDPTIYISSLYNIYDSATGCILIIVYKLSIRKQFRSKNLYITHNNNLLQCYIAGWILATIFSITWYAQNASKNRCITPIKHKSSRGFHASWVETIRPCLLWLNGFICPRFLCNPASHRSKWQACD